MATIEKFRKKETNGQQWQNSELICKFGRRSSFVVHVDGCLDDAMRLSAVGPVSVFNDDDVDDNRIEM